MIYMSGSVCPMAAWPLIRPNHTTTLEWFVVSLWVQYMHILLNTTKYIKIYDQKTKNARDAIYTQLELKEGFL